MATFPIQTLAQIRTSASLRADLPDVSTTSQVTTAEWNDWINNSLAELYGILRQSYGDSRYADPDGYSFVTDSIHVDVDDVSQTKGTDYTLSGSTITFTTAPATGAVLRARYTWSSDFTMRETPSGTVNGTNKVFTLSQTPSGDILSSYMLPSDFLAMDGVNLLIGGYPTGWQSTKPFPWGERNRWSFPATTIQYGRTNLRYCLRGDFLVLRPWPQSGQTVKVDYIPRMTTLSADSDTSDGIGGWLEYVVVDCAIKAKEKLDRDPSVLLLQKAALVKRIQQESANRDEGEPARITDSQGAAGWFGGGSYHGVWPGGGW